MLAESEELNRQFDKCHHRMLCPRPIKPSINEDVVDDSTSPPTTSTVGRDEFDYKCDMEIYMIKYKKYLLEVWRTIYQ